MSQYVLRRFAQSVIVTLVVITLVFIAGRLVGDPARLMLSVNAQPEAFERLRESLGLNQPILVQYWEFLKGAVSGNFGDSYWQKTPALGLALERVPNTLYLAAVAIGIAFPLAVVLGAIAALWPGSFIDRAVNVISLGGVSIVDFWLGLMLILVVSVQFGLLPTSGFGDFRYAILPALTLLVRPLGRITQITRSSVLDELSKPYVKMARAKGLSETRILFRHGLRNALIPIVTLSGDETTSILNGAVVVETVFAWPGVGLLLIQAIERRDLPLIEALVFIVAMMIILTNLIIDLSYAYIDPRIRYS